MEAILGITLAVRCATYMRLILQIPTHQMRSSSSQQCSPKLPADPAGGALYAPTDPRITESPRSSSRPRRLSVSPPHFFEGTTSTAYKLLVDAELCRKTRRAQPSYVLSAAECRVINFCSSQQQQSRCRSASSGRSVQQCLDFWKNNFSPQSYKGCFGLITVFIVCHTER